jgi:glycosyltransferase involved in cell wall biosynthesis
LIRGKHSRAENITIMPQDSSVSVVIRTYNQPSLLKEAIESALNQTLKPVEIIVVDDASTAETPEMMANYRGHEAIRYIRLEENQGMLRTGQIGLEQSKGDYIAFLDHDDLWLPTHLDLCVTALRTSSVAGLAFSRYGLIDLQGRMLVEEVREARFGESAVEVLLFKKVIVTPSRSIYSRRALLDLGGVQPILWDWVYPVLLAAKHEGGVIQLPDRTALFRLHGTQSYSQPGTLLNSLLESTDYIFRNLPPRWQYLRRRVVATNLLHVAIFYWQMGNYREAWACLLRAAKESPRTVMTKEFFRALARLLIHPALGRMARNWKRERQRLRSSSSAASHHSRPGLNGTTSECTPK